MYNKEDKSLKKVETQIELQHKLAYSAAHYLSLEKEFLRNNHDLLEKKLYDLVTAVKNLTDKENKRSIEDRG